MKQLEKKENVVKGSKRSIRYCPDFKVRAVKKINKEKGQIKFF
ncbi:hypothetical protein P3K87_09560 [Bacillus cytotoxicus]